MRPFHGDLDLFGARPPVGCTPRSGAPSFDPLRVGGSTQLDDSVS